MSFSCTIKTKNKDLTKYPNGIIHCQLLDLGPNYQDATDAPYSVSDFRKVVLGCQYGDRLKDAAVDCFKELQSMARENLKSLEEEKHCETCDCKREKKKPVGWSVEALNNLLSIDADTITFIRGGY
jgi:hypothetical protein